MLFSEIIPTVLSIQSDAGIIFASIAFTALILLFITNVLKIIMIKLTTNKSFKEVFSMTFDSKADFLTFSFFAVLVIIILMIVILYIIPIIVLFGYCLFESIHEFLLSLRV